MVSLNRLCHSSFLQLIRLMEKECRSDDDWLLNNVWSFTPLDPTLTRFLLTSWEVNFVRVDLMGVDSVGGDFMGISPKYECFHPLFSSIYKPEPTLFMLAAACRSINHNYMHRMFSCSMQANRATQNKKQDWRELNQKNYTYDGLNC